MTAMEKITEALERVSVKGSRSHYSNGDEKALGKAFACTSGFGTLDLIVAVLEVEGLGADTEERRRIAEAVGWPVREAMYAWHSEGWRDGFDHCKDRVINRLFA